MKNLENILSELEFLNTQVLEKVEKLNLKELSEKLDRIATADFEKEYFEKNKKQLEQAMKDLLEKEKKMNNIIEDAAKNLEAQKNFYINVLNQLKKENEEFINELQKNKFKTYFIIALASSASIVIVLLMFILWGVDAGFVDYLRMLDAIIKTFSF